METLNFEFGPWTFDLTWSLAIWMMGYISFKWNPKLIAKWEAIFSLCFNRNSEVKLLDPVILSGFMEEQDRESLSFFIKQFFLIMFWILYWNSIIGSLYNNIFKKGYTPLYTLKYLFLLKHYSLTWICCRQIWLIN